MYNFTIYMTTDCNFRCRYCYEDYKNHYQLNEKTLIETLEFMMNYGNKSKILLDFLGGEPLLKKDLIYKAVEYIKTNYPCREVKYYITTNCSLMDDDFIKFMKENKFTVRLSFDGNRETHNLNRVAKDGISYYETILSNIQKVRKNGLPYSVRMTITQNTIPLMYKNICFLHEHELDNICMIMDVNLEFSEELFKEFKEQVKKIIEYYIQEYDNNKKIALDQFDGKMLNFLCDFGNCFSMCNAGVENFKIMPDGNIYPCGFLTNDKKYAIGNIHDGVDIQKAKDIAISNFDKYNRQCIQCNIRDFCHGMKCGYMNYIRTGKINVPSEAECYCEKIFYQGMVRIVDHFLQQTKEKLQETLGGYMEYIDESNLKLNKYGVKVKDMLNDEN